MRMFLLTLLFVVISPQLMAFESRADSLQIERRVKCDTLVFDNLYKNYYDSTDYLLHSYDYDRIQEINNLYKWSREVQTIGYTLTLSLLLCNAVLAVHYDWSLWIDIPCATALCMIVCGSFIAWSDNLKDRAKALESETTYVLHLNNNIELGLTKYSGYNVASCQSLGLGVKFSF